MICLTVLLSPLLARLLSASFFLLFYLLLYVYLSSTDVCVALVSFKYRVHTALSRLRSLYFTYQRTYLAYTRDQSPFFARVFATDVLIRQPLHVLYIIQAYLLRLHGNEHLDAAFVPAPIRFGEGVDVRSG